MKCPQCNKPLKENTQGNDKYCQGHSAFDKYNREQTQKEIGEIKDDKAS